MQPSKLVLVALLCSAFACGDDDAIVDEGNAKTLDKSSTSWDDGVKPMPDPPIMEPGMLDGGTDAAPTDMPTPDAAPEPSTDGGGDAAPVTVSDAGADAG